MYPLELIRSVRLITDSCLEVSSGENIVCIVDGEERMEVATLIAAECIAMGSEVAVILMEPVKEYSCEPPRSVARAMQAADVVITMTSGNLFHTRARRDACDAGAKFAILGEVTKEYLAKLNLTSKDLQEVRALTEKIAHYLTEASSAHLTTKAGTDIRMSLKGREGLAVVPFAKKGTFCLIPGYAEAACPPVEDSVEGVAVIDGTMVGSDALFEGLVEEPFEIHFSKGRIVKISGGKDAKRLLRVLDGLGEGPHFFGELGVNSNHKIPKKLIGTRTDNGIAGHVHLGLCSNHFIGGNLKGDVHLDVLVTSASLFLDGNPIFEDGNLKI